MEDKEEKVRVTLTIALDGKWASYQTTPEIADYIEERLNSSLGFRGKVKRFRLLREEVSNVRSDP